MKAGRVHHSKSEASKLIKDIARSKDGKIDLSNHIKERMKERKVDMLDILCAFRNGRILEDPELDINNNEWKYKFVGNNVDGNNLSIITNIFADERRITLITVFGD